MATDYIRLDEAAKQTGYSPSGVVKRVLEKRPNGIHLDKSAVEAIGTAKARGRGPDKKSAAYKAFATALAGLPQDEIDRRYSDYLANRPKPKAKTARK